MFVCLSFNMKKKGKNKLQICLYDTFKTVIQCLVIWKENINTVIQHITCWIPSITQINIIMKLYLSSQSNVNYKKDISIISGLNISGSSIFKMWGNNLLSAIYYRQHIQEVNSLNCIRHMKYNILELIYFSISKGNWKSKKYIFFGSFRTSEHHTGQTAKYS